MNKEKYALISVFNKRGIVTFAKTLRTLGYMLIATEGTGNHLRKAKIPFITAQKVSRNPERLGDCIKTISFRIQGGILFDRADSDQQRDIEALGIEMIDIVVCNFPPLEAVIKDPDVDFCIRKVDVGGPLMVRAAAINFKHVLPVIDPRDYVRLGKALRKNGLTNSMRQKLAIKAFRYSSLFDQQIVKFLRKRSLRW